MLAITFTAPPQCAQVSISGSVQEFCLFAYSLRGRWTKELHLQ